MLSVTWLCSGMFRTIYLVGIKHWAFAEREHSLSYCHSLALWPRFQLPQHFTVGESVTWFSIDWRMKYFVIWPGYIMCLLYGRGRSNLESVLGGHSCPFTYGLYIFWHQTIFKLIYRLNGRFQDVIISFQIQLYIWVADQVIWLQSQSLTVNLVLCVSMAAKAQRHRDSLDIWNQFKINLQFTVSQ